MPWDDHPDDPDDPDRSDDPDNHQKYQPQGRSRRCPDDVRSCCSAAPVVASLMLAFYEDIVC